MVNKHHKIEVTARINHYQDYFYHSWNEDVQDNFDSLTLKGEDYDYDYDYQDNCLTLTGEDYDYDYQDYCLKGEMPGNSGQWSLHK